MVYPDQHVGPDSPQTFSGSDFEVTLVSQDLDGLAEVLTNLQTISYSTFAETAQVRRLGSQGPTAIISGPRTIAGRMIFLFRGNDPFLKIMSYGATTLQNRSPWEVRHAFIENLPPFDLIIRATGEVPVILGGQTYVQGTNLYLYGVHLTETGASPSIHDLYIEVMYSYMAEFIVPFTGDFSPAAIQTLIKSKIENPAESISDRFNDFDQYQEAGFRRV